ncbi:RNA-dependent RNA polymerase 1 [Hordeum vulgare]|nr:RNA-dependent RNA polymerase 1 [Hordeum vulgare]
MEELTDDDKVEDMLDDRTSKENNVVNITVMRSDAPTTADMNIRHLYEEQVPLSEFGVPLFYEVVTAGKQKS